MTHRKKEIQRLLRLAKKQGVVVSIGGGGHLKWVLPGGIVYTAKTPGDHRAVMNMRSRLRKAGLDGT
jgi:hypothetical protein